MDEAIDNQLAGTSKHLSPNFNAIHLPNKTTAPLHNNVPQNFQYRTQVQPRIGNRLPQLTGKQIGDKNNNI